MMPRSALRVHESDERLTTTDAAQCHSARLGRRVATLLLGVLIAAIPLPVLAQTTTLSGTTTGNVSIAASSGTPLIVGGSVLTGTANFFYSGEGSLGATGTMTSNLSGTGALRFSSPATLVISGTNTYSGGTSVVDGGLIEVTTGGSISHSSSDLRVGVDGGPGSMTLSGGSVAIRAASIGSGQDVTSFLTVTSGTWTGSGALTVASAGATSVFQLDGGSLSSLSSTIGTGVSDIGNQDVSNGSARINGGTWTTTNGLVLGAAGGTGSLTLAGGAVSSGSGTIGDDLGSTGSADVTGGTWTNSGDLTVGGAGSGTLSMSGAGTVIVGGTLFRGTGGTINLSSGGTLQIGNGGNSGAISESLTTNGTLVFDRSDTYDHLHEIDGSGSVVKEGSGTLILSTSNFWSGGTTINGGALEVGVEGALGTGTISFGGGALRFSAGNVTDYSERFNSSGNQQFKLDTNNETVTLGAVIAGSGSTLEKLGGGTLILAADNTYDGTTTVSGGRLEIGAGGTAGAIAGDLVTNATVAFNRSDDVTVGSDISGSGAVETFGGGKVTLTGNNSYTGATTLTSGVLSLGSATALGSTSSISFGGGTLQFTAANHADPSAAFGTAYGQAYKLDTNGQDVTLATDLTSTDSTLEKFGDGTLTLAGNNTFAFGTTLSGGTLSLDSAGALGDPNDASAGTISFAGGTLQYSGNNQSDYSSRFSGNAGQGFSIDTNGQTVTFANDLISSNATLAKLGSGTLALAGNNDLVGGVVLDDGTLRLGSTGAIGTSGPIQFNGGTLQFTSANTTDVSSRFVDIPAQSLRVDINGDPVTFASAIAGDSATTLDKLGSGMLTLSGDNLYGGTTTISAGTLRIGDGGASGQVAGDIVNNGSLVFDRSDAPAYSGVISGSGSVTMDGQGTLTLNGANSYTGATTLARGTLALGSGNALGQTSSLLFAGGGLQYAGVQTDVSGLIATSANQPINLDTNGENVAFATGLTGAGSTLAKYGAGTLTLSGSNSYTGGTTVGGGTLEVVTGGAIDHAAGNLVVVGATLTISGGSVTVNDATLGDGPGATGDLLVSDGQFDAAGTLRIGNGASATGSFALSGGAVTTGAAVVGDQSSTGTVTVSGGTWTNSGNLAVDGGSLTISGGTVTVGGTLSEAAPGSINLQGGGELRIGSGGAGGVLAADLQFDGALVFDSTSASTFDHNLSGNGTLTKEGSGTLTLSADGGYTYLGQTTVSEGELVVDGSLVNSSVVVDAGGLLGGSGTVVGSVTVNSGGVIGPSAAGDPSVFTVGSLTLQAGSQASFGILGDGSLAGTAGTNYGQLRITDTPLALDGALRLNFGNASPFGTGQVFQLFALDGGSPIGHLSSVIAAGTGAYASVTFQQSGDGEWTSSMTGGDQYLRFSEFTGRLEVVPEPSTWTMLGAGGAAATIGALRRRRQRHQKMLGM
jgi:autotransporter-associated beta strand protein/T5SS/PEP-CTERM-associated repeat protein